MASIINPKPLEKPLPAGCHWTNAPSHRAYFWEILDFQPPTMDCDCMLTGSCQFGEPPPPPIYEFIPDLVEHIYGKYEKRPIKKVRRSKQEPGPSPTKFSESGGIAEPYEFHWGGWHSPYTDGPRPGELPYHGYPSSPPPRMRRRFMSRGLEDTGVIVRVTNDPDHVFEKEVREGRFKLSESTAVKPAIGSGIGLVVFFFVLVWVVM